MLAVPVLCVIFVIRWILGKTKKKLGIIALVCFVSIPIFAVIGTYTDPGFGCEHEYYETDRRDATCEKNGWITYHCDLCDGDLTEKVEATGHELELVERVEAGCDSNGYEEHKCLNCLETFRTDISSLGHKWIEITRTEASVNSDGVVSERCDRCDETRKTIIEKLSIDDCEHNYEIVAELLPTCIDDGGIVKKCSVCGHELTEVINKLGHAMTENCYIPPSIENEGQEILRCGRCGFEEIKYVDKLEPIVVKFNALQLTFGQYSIVEIDNVFSRYYGKEVVKIPVEIKNLSSDAHSLNYFYYHLFGPSGVEERISAWFDDDVAAAGELMPGSSYKKSFHILYEGDGIYTIMFDDLWFEEETVEITIVK